MSSGTPSLSWMQTFRSYLDKRLLWVFMLGCSSGFPLVLIGSNMSGWLKDAGLTRAAIGYFGSVLAVYAINFLWAPLIDRVKLPFLHSHLGQRRSWIFLPQLLMLFMTIGMAWFGPSVSFHKSAEQDQDPTLTITSRKSNWGNESPTVYWKSGIDNNNERVVWQTQNYSHLSFSFHSSDFNEAIVTLINEAKLNDVDIQPIIVRAKLDNPTDNKWQQVLIPLPEGTQQLTELRLGFEGLGNITLSQFALKNSDQSLYKSFPIKNEHEDEEKADGFWAVKSSSGGWLNYTTILTLSIIAFGVAFASSTQDIAIDAFRIDTFPKSEASKLPQASAMAVMGWWTGYSLPGYLAFINADTIGWNGVYYGMAGVVIILMLFTLFVGEPTTQREALQKEAQQRHNKAVGSKVVAWLSVTVLEPFYDFFKRNGVQVAITLLLFVFLFKIGEAFLGRMSIPFYKEIGFSNEQIGHYSKLIGWGATIFFTLLGSVFNVKFGIVRGLMIGGVAMAASNLMFAWIAQVGPNENLFLATIIVDNFTTAFSTVAFVSFLTLLTGQAFSATQYALLASLGNFGRTTLASFSGELVDFLNDWSTFFILTSLMVIPSLIMLYSLRHFFTDLLEKAKQNHE